VKVLRESVDEKRVARSTVMSLQCRTIRLGEFKTKHLQIRLLTVVVCLAIASAFAAQVGQEVTVRADGTLVLKDATEIPPFAAGGNWIEGSAKHTDRFRTRHFLFARAGSPPAVELFLIDDLTGERPDGIFEAAFIEGFVRNFSAGMGLTRGTDAVDDTKIGNITAKRHKVELRNGDTRIWVYAYVFTRQPSLLFLALRPEGYAVGIEDYLARVRFRGDIVRR
jgi:hypothetical protein